ncbi:MAG: hypothetical protein DMF63_04150 [Acidobacteria bacterium]|nr:MAG: hypothetical protein DMF63_04150 [Acidobacteriota bacterium]
MNMKKDRREFIKSSCKALSMVAAATQLRHFGAMSVLAQKAVEASPEVEYKALVCVFLEGGNDSNNVVVPNYTEGYAQYSAARSAQGLAIPQANLLPVTPPAMQGQVYGLHPALTDIRNLWNDGKVAVACNVGPLVRPITRAEYQSGAPRPYQLFSHSDQVEQFRTAISTFKSPTGWGGRLADRTAILNQGAAISMITSIAGTNVFNVGVNSQPLIVTPAPTPLNQVLTLTGYGTAADELARRAALDQIRTRDLDKTMVQATSVLTQQAVNVSVQLSQNPVLTVTFPNTTLGNQLAQVAKLMKFRTQLNLSRQIFFVRLTGFDTHTGQLNNQNNLLIQLNAALKAFYDETVAQGISSQVTTFTMSDFNRTFNPAGSGSNVGTDHAWGSHHFVMGGAVRGGDFYGRPTANGTFFPTLVTSGPDDADTRGRFIPSTSVEQYAGTLSKWYGLPDSDIPIAFPNSANFPTMDLGFMNPG